MTGKPGYLFEFELTALTVCKYRLNFVKAASLEIKTCLKTLHLTKKPDQFTFLSVCHFLRKDFFYNLRQQTQILIYFKKKLFEFFTTKKTILTDETTLNNFKNHFIFDMFPTANYSRL